MKIHKHINIVDKQSLIYTEIRPANRENYNLDKQGNCADDMIFDPSLMIEYTQKDITFIESGTTKTVVELLYDFGMLQVVDPRKVIDEDLSGHFKSRWKVDENSSISALLGTPCGCEFSMERVKMD